MTLLTGTGLRINRYCSTADFPFFKMAAVRHLGFVKVGNFNCPYPSEGQNASSCQISRRSVKPFWRYGRFKIFKMAVVRHLEFLKVGNFTFSFLQIPTMRHHTKFREDGSNRFGDMAVFRFFKKAAVRHLGFVLHVLVLPCHVQ